MGLNGSKLLWTCAFGLIAAAYIAGLFIDLTGDSGLYAAISRQMVESGNWFELKINGQPYDQKPHLFFWLAGAGIKLMGNTNLAFKLFPFLYGMLGIWFTYALGRQLFSIQVGKVAALITGTSQISFLYFFDIHTDTVMMTGIMLAIWQLSAYLHKGRTVNFIAGFTGIGLAMLSKGPVGALLPFFVCLFYLLLTKNLKRLFRIEWIIGVFIALVVVSPSLVHLYNSFGIEGIKFYFLTNNLGRITGEYAGSSSDPLFYLHTSLWAFLPWTLIVVVTLLYLIGNIRRSQNDNVWGNAIFLSAIAVLTLLSIARGKAPNYFLSFIPLLTVVISSTLINIKKKSLKYYGLIVKGQMVFAIILGVATFGIWLLMRNSWSLLYLLIGITILLTVLAMFRKNGRSLNRILLTSTLIAGSMNLLMNSYVIPELFKYQGAKQVLEIFERERMDGEKLYNFMPEEYELYFYADSHVENIETWEEFYEIMNDSNVWLYTDEAKYNDIVTMDYHLQRVDTINYRGMNQLTLQFLMPDRRDANLLQNYLIRN